VAVTSTVRTPDVTWDLYGAPGKDVGGYSLEDASRRDERSYETSLDLKAPLGSWKNLDAQVDATVGKEYPRTMGGCQQELHALQVFIAAHHEGLYTREDRTEYAREQHIQCVASDDPRLKRERKYFYNPGTGRVTPLGTLD
jgi:hypothetical protein